MKEENLKEEKMEKIKIGVSSCLLGNEVRFDGGHKRDYFLTDTLSKFVEFVPICAEVELGLPIPRETLRLQKINDEVRLIFNKSKEDITQKMERFSEKRVKAVEEENLSGFILKKDSPSCGMERVKVYSEKGIPEKNGRGIFAKILIEKYPLLPVEEEGRLNDPVLRENFFERVFAYERIKNFFSTKWHYRDLIEFHSREKLFLMAHDNSGYRELGKIVAESSKVDKDVLKKRYFEIFMNSAKKHSTVKKNFNVLQHIYGYLKEKLSPIEKDELFSVFEDYKNSIIPLIVPITLLRHHLLIYDVKYILKQTYLSPSPKELMLRNHS